MMGGVDDVKREKRKEAGVSGSSKLEMRDEQNDPLEGDILSGENGGKCLHRAPFVLYLCFQQFRRCTSQSCCFRSLEHPHDLANYTGA